PSDLTKQKANVSDFSALVNNKIDLNVLINGFLKVLKDKKSFDRFYNFIFKRFNENEIFNSKNNIGSNNGVGNLIFDLINWVEKKLHNFSNLLETLIKFVDFAMSDEKIKKTFEENIKNFITKKLNELGTPLGKWHVEIKNGILNISAGSLWLASLTAKIEVFSKDGIIPKIIDVLKKIHGIINNSSETIIKHIKEIFYLAKDNILDFSITSKNISEIIMTFKKLLINKKILNVNVKALFIKLLDISSIYDILELPYSNSALKWILERFAKDKIEPHLKKIKSISETLQKNKFIQDADKIKEQLPKYLELFSSHFKKYEKSSDLKFNLNISLYEGNIIEDLILKWINFLLQDAENKENPLLPIIRLITKKNSLETLDDIKNEWVSKITNISKKIESFQNISKIRDKKIDIPKELLKYFGLESINNQTILQLLEILGKYF
ncbi:STREFT protein, partial [Mycoplasma leachii]|uniref:STREFT protein n=1 Tax=Mycoplasma leachii TaxID=2105 RepID=UPI0011B1D855